MSANKLGRSDGRVILTGQDLPGSFRLLGKVLPEVVGYKEFLDMSLVQLQVFSHGRDRVVKVVVQLIAVREVR